MPERTRIYLDVDQVVNADVPFGWGPVRTGTALYEGLASRVRWAPRMLDALTALNVNIIWVTTWRDDAPTHLAELIGFGAAFPVLHPLDGITSYPSIYWKMEAIEADQARSPSRFIWIDDELGDAHAYYAREHGGLALRPNPVTGIRVQDLAVITAFLEQDTTVLGAAGE